MNTWSALLVDDDPIIIELIQKFLGVQNEIISCQTLEAARKILSDRTFDVVLLDHHLPDGKGATFIPELVSKYPQLPVIVLSGELDYSLAYKCLSLGADDYVIKSEQIIPDLTVRIPLALGKFKAQSNFRTWSHKLPSSVGDINSESYKNFVSGSEAQYLNRAMLLFNQNVSALARALGISRATLFKKVNELKINRNHRSAQSFPFSPEDQLA